jgi:hypothetical protein
MLSLYALRVTKQVAPGIVNDVRLWQLGTRHDIRSLYHHGEM